MRELDMDEGQKKFRLIVGGAAASIVLRGMGIDILSDATVPLPVDVRVFEEDTYLVLTVDPVMRYREEHPVRLMTRVMEEKPGKPGDVVMKYTSWYAVVHDLDAEPSCRAEWVYQAYGEVLRLAEHKGVERLGLPLLGTVHGVVPFHESMSLFIEQIRQLTFARLKKISILVHAGLETEVKKMLFNVSK